VDVKLGQLLDVLNTSVLNAFDREHRIGHSYFLDDEGRPLQEPDQLIFAFRYRIVPLLQDYCLDDFGVLQTILGPRFVDVDSQVVRSEVFASAEVFKDALLMIPGMPSAAQ
jgi:5-methylcytosine-specific restriction protein B